MISNDWRAELSSIEESEARREDFGPIRWLLLRLANVDTRDIVSHSDRAAYTFIGGVVAVFGIYGFLAWLQFLSRIGVDRLGTVGGPAVKVGGALLAAMTIVGFDRFLVGQTKPKFDYVLPLPPKYEIATDSPPGPREIDEGEESTKPEAPENADVAAQRVVQAREEAARKFERVYLENSRELSSKARIPSLVRGRMLFGAIFRMLIALTVASFVTQAVSAFIFKGDIQRQRADNQIAKIDRSIGALNRENQAVIDNNRAEARQRAEARNSARTNMLKAEHRIGHGCAQRAFAHTVCGDARKAYLDAQDAIDDLKAKSPANPKSKAFEAHRRRVGALRALAKKYDDTPSLVPEKASGGVLEPSRELSEYIARHPGAKQFHRLVLVLFILVDLAAIIAKLVCHNSEYERRQAFRRWLSLTAVTLGEVHQHDEHHRHARRAAAHSAFHDAIELEGQVTELHRTRAIESALRAALDRGPEVREDADAAAEWQVRENLRAQTPDDEGAPPPPRPPADGYRTGFRPGAPLVGRSAWTLVKPISESNHSIIWQARSSTDPSRLVAIKLLPLGLEAEAERAVNERKWLHVVGRQRNVAGIVDEAFGADGRGAWYATAWADLGDLDQYYAVSQRPQRRIGEVLMFAYQIFYALAHVPEVVHGDIKPANLLLYSNTDGSLRGCPVLALCDWGLAAGHGQPKGIEIPAWGTIEFASEQAMRRGTEVVSVLDDVFSLGAVLYWCITGEEPGTRGLVRPGVAGDAFDAYVAQVQQARRRMRPARELVERVPRLPIEVAEFVDQLLSPDRKSRVPEVVEENGPYRDYVGAVLKRIEHLINLLEQRGELAVLVGPGVPDEPRDSPPPFTDPDPDPPSGPDRGGGASGPPGRPSTGEDGGGRDSGPPPTGDDGLHVPTSARGPWGWGGGRFPDDDRSEDVE